MFESLTQKLTSALGHLTSRGHLTEGEINDGLREVRLALLEADVNFNVARGFIERVRDQAIGSKVLDSLTPGQQIVKIVHDEITATLGGEHAKLNNSAKPPTVIMLAGLQGSGKTTTAAKLAFHLKQSGQKTLLVAGDRNRMAAVEQLEILGGQMDISVYSERGSSDPISVCLNGLKKGKDLGVGWVILDTSGRLHVDDEMMEELKGIKDSLSPHEILLVVDAMTGQDAVLSAQGFREYIDPTGIIMTKLDGDARGGAAFSITSVTGLPIKFMGVGERLESLEPFYPDRLASRILGMGDVVTLVEKAQSSMDSDRAQELERKFRKATFDLEDFLEQVHQLNRMGPLDQVLNMIPGFSSISRRMSESELDGSRLKKLEAIVYSMTVMERRNPAIINGSRRRRIARGSGTMPQDVNQLLNQFRQMQKMMKQMASGKMQRGLKGWFN